MPSYSRFRPDFEAPGPHVVIEKKDGISFQSPVRDNHVDDDDDDFTRYRYYESDKILGKLYRAIDEREIFADIQARSHISSATYTSIAINQVWNHVQKKCQLFVCKHHREWATDIREM